MTDQTKVVKKSAINFNDFVIEIEYTSMTTGKLTIIEPTRVINDQGNVEYNHDDEAVTNWWHFHIVRDQTRDDQRDGDLFVGYQIDFYRFSYCSQDEINNPLIKSQKGIILSATHDMTCFCCYTYNESMGNDPVEAWVKGKLVDRIPDWRSNFPRYLW